LKGKYWPVFFLQIILGQKENTADSGEPTCGRPKSLANE